MTPEQIRKLKTKSKDDLIKIIINLDKKLFHVIKDCVREVSMNKHMGLSEFLKESEKKK